MKKISALLAFATITAIFLILFAPYTSDTELFTPKNIPGTEKNLNPDALRQISIESSGKAISMMQDFVDLSGTIIVNIRYKNLDDAKEDLQDYRLLLRQYDYMVVRMDMSESEMEEYRKNNREELENLENLTEMVEDLEELKNLQIQYQDSDDPDKYYSVTYEMNTINEKINEIKKELSEITDKNIQYSDKYELQTDELKKSSKEIYLIGDEALNITSSSTLNITPTVTQNITQNITSEKDSNEPDETGDLILRAGIFAGIILLFAGAAYLYYNKKSRKTIENVQKPTEITIDKRTKKHDKDQTFEKYSKLISEGRENEAYRFISKHLFQAVAQKENIRYNPSMTNNEFISMLPHGNELLPFTKLYERIVYSGRASPEEKEELYEIFNELMIKITGDIE